jgi:putative phosphoesterase
MRIGRGTETPPTLRIFVLADTHNRLPEAVSKLPRDADEIWHLGDVCAERILDELRAIGPPVTVVRGNCDSNYEWPLVVDLERGGLKFRLQHIPPERPPEDVDVVLHGHTHVSRNERRGGVLFLNPGCVTRPNQGSPASAARLTISGDGKLDWRLISLR